MARKLTSPSARQRTRPEPVTICILPAVPPGATPSWGPGLVDALSTALEAFGPTLALDRAAVAGRFADGTVARLGTKFYRSKLTGWMAQQEEDYRFILLLAEPSANSWSEICVSQVRQPGPPRYA